MTCLEALAREGKLLCPDSHSPLQVRDGRVLSIDTGRDFGPVAGPLDFLKPCRKTIDASQVPIIEIEKIKNHLQLAGSAVVDSEVAQAIAATGAQLHEPHLSAEAKMLTERFKISEFDLPGGERVRQSLLGRFTAAVGKRISASPRPLHDLRHLSNSIGERLTAGQEVYRSVRVCNVGNTILHAAGPCVARVDVRWTTADGTPLPHCSTLNELPVDIDSGREITLILRLRPPAESGSFQLQVHLAVAGATPAAPFFTTAVQIILCELPVFEYQYFPDQLEYGADHHVAMQEVDRLLKDRYPGISATLLEIGGGVHPTGHALAALGHRVVSCDISHAQSILGTLFFQQHRPELGASLSFITGEGTDLPFANASLDGVVLFAAFHHFADPLGLLAEIKRVIRPGGIIFIGCDCCVPNPADPTYRDELGRGINEQMWTLAEMTDFFRIAGLEVARARVDHHSLKVGLISGDGGSIAPRQ